MSCLVNPMIRFKVSYAQGYYFANARTVQEAIAQVRTKLIAKAASEAKIDGLDLGSPGVIDPALASYESFAKSVSTATVSVRW